MSRRPDNPDDEAATTKDEINNRSEGPERNKNESSELGDYSVEELEEGLTLIGLGQYNLKYCTIISLLLISSMIEVVGNSIVLPAAKCDLDMSDRTRGVITAIPFIGIVLTSYFHGYLIDTRGRKKMAVYTSLAAGTTAFLSALAPSLGLFVFFKLLSSLTIAVPSALPYTFIGEIVPKQHRDRLLSVTNAIQLIGAALDPLIAWIVLPLEFKINFGSFMFRPWRLLIMIYSLFLILTACLLAFGPESPKFLLSRGKPDAALKVLQTMYTGNTGRPPQEFPIKSLHAPPLSEPLNIIQCMKRQTTPLLEKKYKRYVLLNGCLLFGVFVILNGVYVWVIDTMNRVLSFDGDGLTACEIIMASSQYDEEDKVCDDAIDITAIMLNAIAQVMCAIVGVVVSFAVDYIGKYYVLVSCFVIIGGCCVLVNWHTSTMLFVVIMSTLPLITLAIGPIHAYCMEIFPIHMRGMAVLLSMMVGRIGSIVGTTLTGLMIDYACHEMFFLFGVFLFACAFVTTLLPGAPNMNRVKEVFQLKLQKLKNLRKK